MEEKHLELNTDNIMHQAENENETENYEDVDDFIFSESTGKTVSERWFLVDKSYL